MDGGGREELRTSEAEQVPVGGAGDLGLDLRLIVRHVKQLYLQVLSPEATVKPVSEFTWWWGRVCSSVRKEAWVALRNQGSSRAWGRVTRSSEPGKSEP